MATYSEAVAWIAANDAAGDTPSGMSWPDALAMVDGMLTVCLVADIFGKNQKDVAAAVLRARGFVKPRGQSAAEH